MGYNWSPRELQAVGQFSRFSLAKLRRLQVVCEQQTKIAYERKLDDALWRLQRTAQILAAAVDRKAGRYFY